VPSSSRRVLLAVLLAGCGPKSPSASASCVECAKEAPRAATVPASVPASVPGSMPASVAASVAAPDPVTPTAVVPERPAPDQLTPLFVEMVGHYVAVQSAKDALVRGDTGTARSILVDLGGRQVHPSVPDALRGYAAALASEAAKASAATDRRQVADVLARTLVRCGDCHTAGGVTVRDVPWPVPEGSSVGAHMRRHDWVADRMWSALVQGSSSAWAEAMRVLEEPTAERAVAGGDAGLQAMAKRVHELGRSAEAVTDPWQRAAIVGELYATCGDCHATMGRGP
jgi:hypothetical protein